MPIPRFPCYSHPLTTARMSSPCFRSHGRPVNPFQPEMMNLNVTTTATVLHSASYHIRCPLTSLVPVLAQNRNENSSSVLPYHELPYRILILLIRSEPGTARYQVQSPMPQSRLADKGCLSGYSCEARYAYPRRLLPVPNYPLAVIAPAESL